jgi:glycosyltransferase involved in cell wall biosynthesis
MMQPEKQLLIITNRYPSGPNDIASPFVHDFRLALNAMDIRTDIVTPYYKSRFAEADYLDEAVHRFPWSDGTKVISQLPFYKAGTFFKIRRYVRNGLLTASELVKAHHYEAILALWAAPSGYIAFKLSQKYGIPYGVWALGSDINRWTAVPLIGDIIMKVLEEADIRFADGYELSLKVRALTNKDCHFIPSYHKIDVECEKPHKAKMQFTVVGRIDKGKGVFDLLDAFRIFQKANQGWYLCYIGSGRDEKELKKRIRLFNLDTAVTVAGYLPREQINRILVESTAAIIPSHADSMPLTFGEAMQIGVPVICSDVGDMPYFIDAYRVGYHYPAGNVRALAEKMTAIVDKRDEFAANCSDVLCELDISKSAQAVYDWLETLMPTKESRRFIDAHI